MVRILLADDDAKVRAAVRMMLEEADFEVVEAKDGEELVHMFYSQPADLILCDLFMPVKEGLEAIQELNREFFGVKIIAMSGGGFKGAVDLLPAARHLGAAEVLYKPFDQLTLLTVIRRLLDITPDKSSLQYRRELGECER
jgi:CheY-like chemotaxis protein